MGIKNNLLVDNINYKQGDSILSLWKKIFSKNKEHNFLYDSLFGNQTKKDFIIKAYLLSKYIKKIEGKYIGIMLPAIGSSSLLIIATYIAGKVPVIFNWTLSKDAFHHCVKFSKVDKILTANSFYNKINVEYLHEYKNTSKFIFLDELLSNVTALEKLTAYVKQFYMPVTHIKSDGEAVILFTSGTENLPKAVALTHANIIENIIGAISIFDVKNEDILLGFLPPFHSFGFTVNTIMPLITGLKLVNSPDPNDIQTIVSLIKSKKITAITATPTFLKMIMNLASFSDLKTVKYVVVGAEKCSKEIFDKFSKLSNNGKILEGYGITECSPVISINPIKSSKPGTVGKIIQTLDYKILDLKSDKELGNGETGLLYVSGKSVFTGYLDKSIENPFTQIDGTKYYNTGDIGFVDSDGFLTLKGRIKRFVKIGGEMISLPFIEEVLSEKFNSNGNHIAIEALESDNRVKIVMFSSINIDIEKINNYLRTQEVSSIIKISELIIVNKIPVLGTGKIDYKVLKKLIVFDNDKINTSYNKDGSIESVLYQKIIELLGIENIKIDSNSIFGKDIHLDSIDVGELMVFIRKKYNIKGNISILNIKTFGELVNLVINNKGI